MSFALLALMPLLCAARITSDRDCTPVQSYYLNRQPPVEVWLDALNCNGVPDGDTLECPVFVHRLMARGGAVDSAGLGEAAGVARQLLEYHSVRCLHHNSLLRYSIMLHEVSTRMEAAGWAVQGIVAFLQEIEDCVLSGGPPCANTTTQFTYEAFDEPLCIEDEDDDGSVLNDQDDDFDHVHCGRDRPVPIRTFPNAQAPTVTQRMQLESLVYTQIPAATSAAALEALLTQVDTLAQALPLPRRVEQQTHVVQQNRDAYMHTSLNDILRYTRAIADRLQYPFIDRTLSCLEQFYFGAPNPASSTALGDFYARHQVLYRIASIIDDDDSSDEPLLTVRRCDGGARTNRKGASLQPFGPLRPLDRVACHPFDDDDGCAVWGGGAERKGDPIHCVRYYEKTALDKADQMMTALMNAVRSHHVRASFIAEYLRQARENGDVAAYVFPSNSTGCFQLAAGQYRAMRAGSFAP